MRVLYYIEPEFEFDDPANKANWVSSWIPRLARSVREAFGLRAEQYVTLNEVTAGALPGDCGVEPVIFRQSDLYELGSEDPFERRVAAFNDPESAAGRRRARTYQVRLAGREPDLIIALSAGDFLRSAFPSAALLNHEYSCYCRGPTPEAWFFDPVGPYYTSWADKNWTEFRKSWSPSEPELRASEVIASAYRGAFASVFRAERAAFVRKHVRNRPLSMLALQVPGYPLMDGVCAVRSQLQLTLHALEAVGPDRDLLIHDHPASRGISPSARDYIRSRYDNAVFADFGTKTWTSGDIVASYMSHVITGTSKAAGMGLMWNIPFLRTQDTVFGSIASGRFPADINDAVSMPDHERASLLAWTLLRTQVLAEQIEDPEWMRSLLSEALNRHRARDDWSRPLTPVWREPQDMAALWVQRIGEHSASARKEEFMRQVAFGPSGRDSGAPLDQAWAHAVGALKEGDLVLLHEHIGGCLDAFASNPSEALPAFKQFAQLCSRIASAAAYYDNAATIAAWGRLVWVEALAEAGDFDEAQREANRLAQDLSIALRPESQLTSRLRRHGSLGVAATSPSPTIDASAPEIFTGGPEQTVPPLTAFDERISTAARDAMEQSARLRKAMEKMKCSLETSKRKSDDPSRSVKGKRKRGGSSGT